MVNYNLKCPMTTSFALQIYFFRFSLIRYSLCDLLTLSCFACTRAISGKEVKKLLLTNSHGSGTTFPGPRALKIVASVSSIETYTHLVHDTDLSFFYKLYICDLGKNRSNDVLIFTYLLVYIYIGILSVNNLGNFLSQI